MSATREKSWFASINLWLRAPPMCMYVPFSTHNRFSALKIWREICRYPFVAWQCWSSGNVNSGYGATATGFLVILVSALHFFNGQLPVHPRPPTLPPRMSRATMSHTPQGSTTSLRLSPTTLCLLPRSELAVLTLPPLSREYLAKARDVAAVTRFAPCITYTYCKWCVWRCLTLHFPAEPTPDEIKRMQVISSSSSGSSSSSKTR